MTDRAGRTEQLSTTAPPPPGQEAADPTVAPDRRRRSKRWKRAGAGLALLFVAALIADLVVTNLRLSDEHPISSGTVNNIASGQANAAISRLKSEPPAATTAYSAVRDGLVLIETKRKGVQGVADLGSGVVVDTGGEILTAFHVVKGASAIEVTFADGSTSVAAVNTANANDDIAVLTTKQRPAVLIPAVLGGPPQVGDPVFALGNPVGLVATLTAGVVSGLDRTFTASGGRQLSGLIQFDAAINPGSSGGPLLNAKGQVIGIVTGLANPSGSDSFSGIGFAVPIAVAGQSAGAPSK